MSKKVDGFDILYFSSTDYRIKIVHLNVFTATFAEVKQLRIVNKMTNKITTALPDPVDIIINLIICSECVVRSGRSVVCISKQNLIKYQCK